MDILNHMDEEKYSELSDFLAFVGMYEDRNRIRIYRKLMDAHRDAIEGGVVVEAGAGFGIFSEYALQLGARRVYVVERNWYMLRILRRKFENDGRVKVVPADIMQFVPDEEVDVLIHDFYGPLLYDESLYALEHLNFRPRVLLPDSGRLVMNVVPFSDILDDVVGEEVVEQLRGVLVADLFDYDSSNFSHVVLEWGWKEGLRGGDFTLNDAREDSMLVFALELWHGDEFLCRAGDCSNWSLVFTPVAGKRFRFRFTWDGDFTRVYFRWVE